MVTKVNFTVSTIDTPAGERWVAAAWDGSEIVMTQKTHGSYTAAREDIAREVEIAGKPWQLAYFQSGRGC